ncbi:MAG: hypothetical protein HY898_11895 [Deltaproteobacteria bacterium]|nr:hypothetical protein [Deltaproteobacteria bacterium]
MKATREAKNEAPRVYGGVERRRHTMFVTRNSEYHFRDGLCVAVRDRASGEWLPGHVALNRQLSGSLKFYPNGAIRPNLGNPRVGESLFFATGGRDLVTSPLLEVGRPEKKFVEDYPRPLRRR